MSITTDFLRDAMVYSFSFSFCFEKKLEVYRSIQYRCFGSRLQGRRWIHRLNLNSECDPPFSDPGTWAANNVTFFKTLGFYLCVEEVKSPACVFLKE